MFSHLDPESAATAEGRRVHADNRPSPDRDAYRMYDDADRADWEDRMRDRAADEAEWARDLA